MQAAPYTQVLFKQTVVDGAVTETFNLQTLPNPFNNNLGIQFQLQKESVVIITIYDSKGGMVKQVYSGKRQAGVQQFGIDGTSWSNGIYFCDVSIDGVHLQRKLMLQK